MDEATFAEQATDLEEIARRGAAAAGVGRDRADGEQAGKSWRMEAIQGLPDALRDAVLTHTKEPVRTRIAGALALRDTPAWQAAAAPDRAIAADALASITVDNDDAQLPPGIRAAIAMVLGRPDRAGGWSDAPDAVPAVSEPFDAVDGDQWAPDGGWPKREWLIPGWLPVGRLGLLSGRGGHGKSRIVLQVAARIAATPPAEGLVLPSNGQGKSTAGSNALPPSLHTRNCGPVVFASWEDERDEAGRRIEAMARDEVIPQPATLTGRLRWLDLRGAGPLWAPDPSGSRHVSTLASLTALGGRVRATCEKLRARMLVVDSVAGAYASNENDRSLVRAFCASWDAWASETGCAVLLIAHPPKAPSGRHAAAPADDDFSGSTDWHNAARFRWTLAPAPTGERHKIDGKDQPITALALTLAKASYGRDGARVFVLPSPSGLGWRATTPAAVAQAGFALESDGHDEDAIR